MKILRKIRNYLCYCGIEKEEYEAVKREAFAANFEIWRLLHCVMTFAFGFLFIYSLFDHLFEMNRWFYLMLFVYSAVMTGFFFILKKRSILPQFLIYLSISMLFLFGCFISQNKHDIPATMFIVMLLITPLFMINRPYLMGIELVCASTVFNVWMYYAKDPLIWQMDMVDVIIYTILGFLIHIIVNSMRIREFVLTRKINIQKDMDEMTGLKNKGALTREIDNFLADPNKDKGIMFMLDINDFKSINDTYGHDVGDSVIHQFGVFLSDTFTVGEILGRFGGDEFIVFIKNTDDLKVASDVAQRIMEGAKAAVHLPDEERFITVSIGIAIYHGEENYYSELFKKADIALYKTKADRSIGFSICE